MIQHTGRIIHHSAVSRAGEKNIQYIIQRSRRKEESLEVNFQIYHY